MDFGGRVAEAANGNCGLSGVLAAFDPDVLLAALPRRQVRPAPQGTVFRSVATLAMPGTSTLGSSGEYNALSGAERRRAAAVSNWLCRLGSVERPTTCSICKAAADDEHAENHYDLSTWIRLCRRCHRSALHGRFVRPHNWETLVDRCEIPGWHWARVVTQQPFDMAGLLRSRSARDPRKGDFVGVALT